MNIEKQVFGITSSGEEVTVFTLTNQNGISVSVLNYGGIIKNILVPDKKGQLADVVLGYDSLSQYEKNNSYYGSFVGRNANRINKALIIIDGQTYQLEKNDRGNNLHSGYKCYNKFIYKGRELTTENCQSVELSRISPDMEQGFPGNLDIHVTYTLTDENELIITYHARSDKDTIVNLTNHSYFNLAGHNSGSILNHKVMILADNFTPIDSKLIPTGEIKEVAETPMDFRNLKSIGQDINADYDQLKLAGGYDHNYVLHTNKSKVSKVAELVEENSGRVMEVLTDMPGMQFYSGNFISRGDIGKDGAEYKEQDGLCFETQHFPNACNTMNFPSSILKAGEEYKHVTIYKFSTI